MQLPGNSTAELLIEKSDISHVYSSSDSYPSTPKAITFQSRQSSGLINAMLGLVNKTSMQLKFLNKEISQLL